MQYKYTALTNISIGVFMVTLDSNIVLIALPTIIRDLPGTPPVDGLWIIMGYILISSVLLVSLGRLADIHGRVKFYTAGFAVFTLGSGLCSLATSGDVLVACRLLQGGGGALIFSSSSAILTDAFPETERGRALGLNQISGVAGSVLGLVAGGVLTQVLGWRSIFWINIPIGALGTAWALSKLRELSIPQRAEKIDFLGNGLFGAGISLFLFGLTFGAIAGWSALFLGMMGSGLLCLILFPLAERRTKSPMMDLSLFSNRQFSAGLLTNLLFTIARGGVGLTLVFYFQGALGYDAFTAGLLLLPFSLAFVTIGTVSGYLSDKYGSRRFSTAGMAISSIALGWFSLLPFNSPYYSLVPPMLLVGFGSGLFVAPNIASIMNAAPANRRGIAAGMSSTLFNTGFLLSLAISFAIMAAGIPLSGLQALLAGLGGATPGIDANLFFGAMRNIFIFMAVISTISIIPASMTTGKASPRPAGGVD